MYVYPKRYARIRIHILHSFVFKNKYVNDCKNAIMRLSFNVHTCGGANLNLWNLTVSNCRYLWNLT